MEPITNQPPLIVIVGQTASGKSALALKLAKEFGGELVCADSRTVYKGMDIGTAKPTKRDRATIPHHLLDITTPDKPITVADFKKYAGEAITDISSRGNIPIMVGGSGLYIDAVLFNFVFRDLGDQTRRKDLEELSVEELQGLLLQKGIAFPNNQQNPRHLIRQLETMGQAGLRHDLRANTLIMGFEISKEDLAARIEQRIEQMLASGLEEEARDLDRRYGRECRALQTIGYQEFWPYFDNQANITDTKALIIRNTIQYAKRQKTWFKRNKSINWICKIEEAVDLSTTYLNK